ncbi:MAG: hypothetical protein WA030_02065 [Candidatus Microsaccharimonas sp.]
MIFSRRNKPGVPTRRTVVSDSPSKPQTSSQFRRNRTMSGVRRETEDPSSRTRVHHLTNARRKVGGIFLLVLGVIVILAIVITQFTAKVVITASSNAPTMPVDGSRYEKVINDYLGIQPVSRFRFVLNEDELSSYATNAAPEIATISQRGSQNVIETRFAITFRKPVAGWQINSRQYYVDDQGIVFERNYYETPTVQIVDESGISPEQGSTVASARLLSFVGRVVALAKGSGYEVTQAILPSGSTRQLEVRLKDVTPLVKLSIDRGAGEQVEDMVRVLNYLTSNGINPSYVDVRVSGRAAYQ